ncbi:MAG: rhodanese-like domain-containing protein [Methylococcales bacterium]|nr:rhodanese-like domain-containing protein [Methylococcales bacterium]
MTKVLLIGLMSIILFACTTTGEGYMQQDDLLAEINQGQAPIIVDVRSASEYQTSHVPGAIHIPFWTAFTTDKLENIAKTKTVILYCEHGPRAGIAKLAFSWAGFDDLKYLAGHMSAWKKAGLPVETKNSDDSAE